MNVREEIINIALNYIDISEENLDTSISLAFASGLDSFGVLSMIGAIEEHFNTKIPEAILFEFRTLDDIIQYMEQVKA